jgi:hypothetical protein
MGPRKIVGRSRETDPLKRLERLNRFVAKLGIR